MFEFAAPVGALSQKRSLSLTFFDFAGQNAHSGKFKHLKFSENVKFSETNSIDSILTDCSKMGPSGDFFQIPRKLRKKGREWERSIFWSLEPLNFDSPDSAIVNISCSS